jgi:hypothetical protein
MDGVFIAFMRVRIHLGISDFYYSSVRNAVDRSRIVKSFAITVTVH